MQEEVFSHRKAMDDAIVEKLNAQAKARDYELKLLQRTKQYEEKLALMSANLESANLTREKAIEVVQEENNKAIKELAEENTALKEQLQILQQNNHRSSQLQNCASKELEMSRIDFEKQLIEINRLQSQHDDLLTQIKDRDEEIAVIEKKRNSMLKELKSQLKQELLRSKDLDAALKAARDELKALKHSNKAAHHRNSGISIVGPSPHPTVKIGIPGRRSTNPITKTGFDHLPRSYSLSPEPKNLSEFDANVPTNSSDIDELMMSSAPIKLGTPEGDEAPMITENFQALITDKFTRLQKQNFVFQEKIQYLEDSIQKINGELEKKKAIITNLIQRIEVGSFHATLSTTKFSAKNTQLKEELYSKMELILHETTLENANLRVSFLSKFILEEAKYQYRIVWRNLEWHLRNYTKKI